jgi:hypothetical protein
MVRINGFGLRAAYAALNFFNLGAEQRYIGNNAVCEELKEKGLVTLNPTQIIKGENKDEEDMVIQLSDGTTSLRVYHEHKVKNIHMYYYDTPDNIQVYLDMDGVFADFESFFIDILGKQKFEEITAKKLWQDVINHMVSQNGGVFNAFKPLARAKELYEFFKPYSPVFLSSTGYTNVKKIEKQKTEWLAKYIDPNAKRIFVDASKKKAYYSAPNAILIDDRPRSILPWAKKRGAFILHKDVDTTMKEFKILYAKIKKAVKHKKNVRLNED